MTVTPSNLAVEELSAELAEAITQPILEAIAMEEDDEAAKALITMIRTLAYEESRALRESFASDLAMRIYAKTMACRDAAMAFAA